MAPFRRIAIVGVGLIGGSIGLAVRRRMPGVRVVGVDRGGVLRRALSRGAVQAGAGSLARGLQGCDLVILALPVDAIALALPRVARLAPPGALVTDVGSTKGAIVAAARRCGLGQRFVGGHPMAGSERSGVGHADGGLFVGAPWILCPGVAGPPAIERVRRLVRRLGARPALFDARRHDAIVARLSHLPQLASVAMVNAAARGPAAGALRLAGPAFRQMSRLAGSSPRLWAGILESNRAAVVQALRDFEREVAALRGSIGSGAAARFRRAARVRARIPRPPRATLR
ncbi:MAG: prephenate dehydrogenase/arogenate dehydrogenase family protein [Acidobacteria bacterium]|nr:MAG: prephenate dehydrogenase/arogenate dehydrogenase family protein [Acidobacteriota bacterium]